MKKAYKIDENGFYTEDYLYEEGQEQETNIVAAIIPQGLYKPKWDSSNWVEGATQEYIDSLKVSTISQPTEADRITALENMVNTLMGV